MATKSKAKAAPKSAPKAAPKAKAKAAPNAKAAPTTGPVLTVVAQPPKPFRGARGAWWAAVQAHNGKPVAAFVAAVLATPPSTPKVGKLANKVEPPAGWVNWFVRQGLVTIN